MFINFKDCINEIRARYFPTRQFVYYVDGEMKFIHFETSRQFGLAVSACLALGLTALMSYDVYFGFTAQKVSPEQSQHIEAEYKRVISDTEAQYNMTVASLTKRQLAFDGVSARLKQKQEVLEILESFGYLDDLSLNLENSTNDNPS